MRARNLCGFEIHMELFFVNEFKKKRKFLDETFITEAVCHNVHCLGKESPLLNSTERRAWSVDSTPFRCDRRQMRESRRDVKHQTNHLLKDYVSVY